MSSHHNSRITLPPGANSQSLQRVSSKEASSYHEFTSSTSDVWDVSDAEDDWLKLAMVAASIPSDPGSASMSASNLVQSTAEQVLKEHSSQLKEQQIGRKSRGTASGDYNSNCSTAVSSSSRAVRVASAKSTSSAPSCTASRVAPGLGVRLNAANGMRICYPHVLSTPEKLHAMKSLKEQSGVCSKEDSRVMRFLELVTEVNPCPLSELRTLAWQGVPAAIRPTVWKLLQGYLPPNTERRSSVLQDKRNMYAGFVSKYYPTRFDKDNEVMFRQIQKDLIRMAVLHKREDIQEIFGRVLFIWSMRRPASTYVQGMNDLVTPFFVVYLSEHCPVTLDCSEALELTEAFPTDAETLAGLEADCFWALSKLLDSIQDNFVFAQPRIQQNVLALRKIIRRVDADLDSHLEQNSVEYLQFSFRWMNNLLMRELPLRCVIRLWDTYQSETDGFSHFHLYVCAAFLLKFSLDLKRERDFQGLMLMLQGLPTHQWTDDDVTMLLAEAYKLQCWFADAPNHLDKAIHR